MPDTAINLQAKLSGFSEHWSPRVVAEMNDYQFKLAKILGEFVWHAHEETDEVFIVLSGEMTLEFRDRAVPLAADQGRVGQDAQTRAGSGERSERNPIVSL